MTPEQQLRALQKIAEKHPRTGIRSAFEKAKADEKVNQLRDEIGYRPVRTAAQKEMLAGLEWM